VRIGAPLFGLCGNPDSTGSDSTGSDSTSADSTGADSTGADSTGSDSTDTDSTDTDSTDTDSTDTDSSCPDSTGWGGTAAPPAPIWTRWLVTLGPDRHPPRQSVVLIVAAGKYISSTYCASMRVVEKSQSEVA